jgi:hypothetical protein
MAKPIGCIKEGEPEVAERRVAVGVVSSMRAQ